MHHGIGTRPAGRLLTALGASVVGLTCLLAANAPPESRAPGAALSAGGQASSTPWVAAHGQFVAAVWGETSAGTTDVYAAVSRDGGAAFAAGVRVNTVPGEARLGGELPPRVALVPSSDGGVPGIVVLWTARGGATEIKVSRSSDGGRSFDTPVALQSPGAAGDRGWPSLAVDAQGLVHAVWLDHRGLAAARAADGHKRHGSGTYDGVAMAQRSSLFYARPGTAEREVAAGVCYCCKTALAAGRDGRLVAAWRHVYPGNLRDIAVSVSPDGGRTFGAPTRVSEDGWAITGCPDDGPAVAVDGSGTIHVVWPTVLQGSQPERAIFYTSSRDGISFRPRVRVPTTTRQPTHPQVVLDRSGRLVVAWDERRDGRTAAALRTLTVIDGAGPKLGPIVELVADGSASYPMLAAAEGSLVAVWTTGGASPTAWARRVAVP